MKARKLLTLLLVCVALFTLTFAVSAQPAADFTGWDWTVDDNGEFEAYWVNGQMVTNDWVKDGDWWYYFGADGRRYDDGVHTIGGKHYFFFESGAMAYEGEVNHYNEETYQWEYYYAQGALADGALKQNQWGKDADGDWVYYGSDCKRVDDRVVSIAGKWYGFGYNGKLFCDGEYSIYNSETEEWERYYADADGVLLTNAWKQKTVEYEDGYSYSYWVYYGANGAKYSNEVANIGGKYYYFDGEAMLEDGECSIGYWDDEQELWIATGSYRARKDGSLYVNEWYCDEWDNWYYYGEGGLSPMGLASIGGKTYCFNGWGRMLQDECTSVYINGVFRHYIADENGVAYEAANNNWTKVGDAWYYVRDNEFLRNGVYLFGTSTYYGFDDNGRMFDGEFFEIYDHEAEDWNDYYAKVGGVLARNEVLKVVRYEGDSADWYLFGDDCARPNYYGLYELNGKLYYVRGGEPIATEMIYQTENGVYSFGADGVGTKLDNEKWHKNTFYTYVEDQYWFYVRDDEMLSGGVYQIGSKKYAFDYDGRIVTDNIFYDDEREAYWLATYMDKNGNGGSICEEKNVWKKVNGQHVYLTGDSTLHYGWLSDKYFMTPYMYYCTYALDGDGYIRVVGVDGIAKRATTTGFVTIHGYQYYMEGGKLVTDAWKKIGGAWYYFDVYGDMAVDGTYKIDGKWYYFDVNGKMFDKGWVRDRYGDWRWAGPSGALFTGIDSAGYVFDEEGWLAVNTTVEVNGTWYVTNADGKKIGSFNKVGWNKVGKDWYYLAEYYDYEEDSYYYNLMTGSFCDEQGRYFAFEGRTGRMLHDQFYDGYYLGSNGEALTGWQWIDGAWYYGDPANYGWLYNDGIYTIKDVEYAFDDNGKLKQNQTFFSTDYGMMITTDKDGAVTKKVNVNGWAYNDDSEWGYGEAYYYQNGKPYTGWLGNYYIEDGSMYINQIVRIDGKQYYLNKKGVKVTNGWYELYRNEWVYARADGSLVCDDWLKLGSKWYYFEGIIMAYDGVYEIKGELHKFDENGVWVGEYKEGNGGLDFSNKKDGWVSLGGKWYFSMAGEPVTNEELYIGGKWYYFDYDGVMVSNRFVLDREWHAATYYTADGSRATYTGWKWINNGWAYFNSANEVQRGWIYDGGASYYQDFKFKIYDHGYYGEEVFTGIELFTGYHAIDGVLYYFNNSGALGKTITKQGWYQSGADWYYVDANGEAVSNVEGYKIGNAYYAFYSDGTMVANAVYGYYYYNAGGQRVTKSGWYLADGEWVYVLSNGRTAYDGVFRIGGKDYYFFEGVWVA